LLHRNSQAGAGTIRQESEQVASGGADAKRRQSLGEEIANSVSHGFGFLIAAAATPWLVTEAAGRGTAADVVGAVVFAVTVMLTYLSSTVYHAFPHGAIKRVLRAVDHGAIFLLIAGTYTPFTLGVLRGGWGWSLFGTIWTLALAGIVLKASGGVRFQRLSVALYLGMGWLVLVAIKPLWLAMPPEGLAWLVAGGVAYSGGVVFYALDRIPYCHFVWHLFVLTGTGCHFVAVMRYASLPAGLA
jgi:hemolysin III